MGKGTVKWFNESKGFGFIEMSSEEDAKKAIEQLNGKIFMERALIRKLNLTNTFDFERKQKRAIIGNLVRKWTSLVFTLKLRPVLFSTPKGRPFIICSLTTCADCIDNTVIRKSSLPNF